jgi:hypothetical protein
VFDEEEKTSDEATRRVYIPPSPSPSTRQSPRTSLRGERPSSHPRVVIVLRSQRFSGHDCGMNAFCTSLRGERPSSHPRAVIVLRSQRFSGHVSNVDELRTSLCFSCFLSPPRLWTWLPYECPFSHRCLGRALFVVSCCSPPHGNSVSLFFTGRTRKKVFDVREK